MTDTILGDTTFEEILERECRSWEGLRCGRTDPDSEPEVDSRRTVAPEEDPPWIATQKFLELPVDLPLLDRYPKLSKFILDDKGRDWYDDYECEPSGLEKEPLVWPLARGSGPEEAEDALEAAEGDPGLDAGAVHRAIDGYIEHLEAEVGGSSGMTQLRRRQSAASLGYQRPQWYLYNSSSVVQAPWTLYSLSALPPGININLGDDEETPVFNFHRKEAISVRKRSLKDGTLERLLKGRSFQSPAGQETSTSSSIQSSSAVSYLSRSSILSTPPTSNSSGSSTPSPDSSQPSSMGPPPQPTRKRPLHVTEAPIQPIIRRRHSVVASRFRS